MAEIKEEKIESIISEKLKQDKTPKRPYSNPVIDYLQRLAYLNEDYADLLHDMMNSINVKLSAEGLLTCSCENEVADDSKESFIQFTNNWSPSQLN